MEKFKHLIDSQQFTPEILFYLFKRADELRSGSREFEKSDLVYRPDEINWNEKILATFFYEPSSRTRLSFESAMQRMGGRVISTPNAREESSAAKGESIEDTIRVVSGYADIIVMRHYEDGSAQRAANVSRVPLINGGDGKGQHPTQALLDVYTIKRELGRLDNLKVAMVGDLANGRTARSLSYLLAKLPNNKLAFVSPESLRMKDDVKDYLRRYNTPFFEYKDLNTILPEADVVYMLRTQKERMTPGEREAVEKEKGRLALTMDNLQLVKPEARVMHPLPKIDEIALPFDVQLNDPRITCFRQAENGLYVRMALLEFMLK